MRSLFSLVWQPVLSVSIQDLSWVSTPLMLSWVQLMLYQFVPLVRTPFPLAHRLIPVYTGVPAPWDLKKELGKVVKTPIDAIIVDIPMQESCWFF